MCGNHSECHHEHDTDDGTITFTMPELGGIDPHDFMMAQRWLNSYLHTWNHSMDEDTLTKRFFKSMRPVDEMADTISLLEYLTYHRCETETCDCIAEFRKARDEYERQLQEFENILQQEKELEEQIELSKEKYRIEAGDKNLTKKRQRFDEMIATGDVGKVPKGFDETKPCSHCHLVLPRTLSFFMRENNLKYAPDGLGSICRICELKAQRWRRSDEGREFIRRSKELTEQKKALPFRVCPTCRLTQDEKGMDFKRSQCRACKAEWVKWDKRLKENPDREYWEEFDRKENARKAKLIRETNERNRDREARQCRFCKEFKPAHTHYFYIKESSPDGLDAACKLCYHENVRKRRNTDPAELQRIKDNRWAEYAAANVDNEEKYCPACEAWFPMDRNHFNLDYTTDDGFRRYCKFCSQEHSRDPTNSKIGRYLHTRNLANWLIFREHYPVELNRKCECCGVTKPWEPENFKWINGRTGMLDIVCADCVDAGLDVIDPILQAELRKQGRKRCNKCFRDRDLSKFTIDRGYEYIYCYDCERTKANLTQMFRRNMNPITKAIDRIGSGVRNFIRKQGLVKEFHTAEIIDCDYKFLVEHLEQGELRLCTRGIHIDHLIPLAWAVAPGDDEQTLKNIKLFFHWSNLRLLDGVENSIKGDRPVPESELPDYLHPEIRAFYDRKIAELDADGKEIDYYIGRNA